MKRLAQCLMAAFLLMGVSALLAAAVHAKQSDRHRIGRAEDYDPAIDPAEALPEAAGEVIRRVFPEAAVAQVGREREHGVMLYEVTLREDGGEFELEVTADGVIGEIERVVELDDVPDEVAEGIRRAAKGGKIRHIERHERRGTFRSGRAVRLDEPTVTYEVTSYRGGRRHYTVVTSDELAAGRGLPEAVRRTIEARFPGATVGKIERGHALGVALFEVELETEEGDVEAVISGEGVLVEVESEIDEKEAPAAVRRALKRLAGERRIEGMETVDVHAVARLEPLDPARRIYEAEWEVDGKEIEVLVDADGTLLARTREEDEEDEEDE